MADREPTLMRFALVFLRNLLVASVFVIAFTKVGPLRFGPFEFASPAWIFWILLPAVVVSAFLAYVMVLPDDKAAYERQMSESEALSEERARAAGLEGQLAAAELGAVESGERLVAAESVSAELEERLVAAELGAVESGDRAVAAELGAAESGERLVAAESASAKLEDRAVAAELVAAGLEGQLIAAELGAVELKDRAVAAELSFAELEESDRHLWMERGYGFPTVVAMLEELDERQDEEVSRWLASKDNPAPKAAELVREHAGRRRAAERERRISQSIIEYYESIAPFLVDLKNEVFGVESSGTESEPNPITPSEIDDPQTIYLTIEELRDS